MTIDPTSVKSHSGIRAPNPVGDQMAEVGAQIVEDLDILIALAPFVIEQTKEVDASPSKAY